MQELRLHRQPLLIPELDQPLLPDETRKERLHSSSLILKILDQRDVSRLPYIVDKQAAVEHHVEAALVHDGFDAQSILSRYSEIRGILHRPRGSVLSEHTYDSYLRQIGESGTRQRSTEIKEGFARAFNGFPDSSPDFRSNCRYHDPEGRVGINCKP
jgi:hypothetical protein